MRILGIQGWFVGVATLLILSGWSAFRVWPRRIDVMAQSRSSIRFEGNRMIAPFPTKVLLAEVERFADELPAYLWFDYLRNRPGIDARTSHRLARRTPSRAVAGARSAREGLLGLAGEEVEPPPALPIKSPSHSPHSCRQARLPSQAEAALHPAHMPPSGMGTLKASLRSLLLQLLQIRPGCFLYSTVGTGNDENSRGSPLLPNSGQSCEPRGPQIVFFLPVVTRIPESLGKRG